MNLISNTITTISPTFTPHSSNNLADVAARVVEQFRHETGGKYDVIFNSNDFGYENTEEGDCYNETDEFEFAVVCNNVDSSSTSVDNQNVHKYPLFDQSLLLDVDFNINNVVDDCKPLRLPLRKLFNEDREFCSSSSSEADDFDGITPGSYCVWKPKTQRSLETCKKSNSTGNTSRRWNKLRDMLYRSNSDSKTTPFLFFKTSVATKKKINNDKDKVKKVEKQVKEGYTNCALTETHDRRPSGEALEHRFSLFPSKSFLFPL